MSLYFEITPRDPDGDDGWGATLYYSGISLTNGRQAIDFDPGAPHQQQFRFHSPGVKGNFLVRDAEVGRAITVVVRYMGSSVSNAEGYYVSDFTKFVGNQVKIECNGQTYKGCNVRPESIRRSSPIRGTGRTAAQVFFNVTMTFTQDNPDGNYDS